MLRRGGLIICLVFASLVGEAHIILPDSLLTVTKSYVFDITSPDTAQEGVTYYEKKDVIGADIRDNVYGGGNEAEVTGNTNVNIGKKND